MVRVFMMNVVANKLLSSFDQEHERVEVRTMVVLI